MGKPEEDLKAILDLFAEWRKENGLGHVSMFICDDGNGQAYNIDDSSERYEARGEYGLYKADSPGAATPGESK